MGTYQLAQYYVHLINTHQLSKLPKDFLPPVEWNEHDGCSWSLDKWYLPWRKVKILDFLFWCKLHDWGYRKLGYWATINRGPHTRKLVDMIWKLGMKSEGSWLLYNIYWQVVRHIGVRAWKT